MTTEITTEHAEAIAAVIAEAEPILRAIRDMAGQWATVERPQRPAVPTGYVPRCAGADDPAPAPREAWQSELDRAATAIAAAQKLLRAKLPDRMACRIKQDQGADAVLRAMHNVAQRWQENYTVQVEMPREATRDIVMTLTRIGGSGHVA